MYALGFGLLGVRRTRLRHLKYRSVALDQRIRGQWLVTKERPASMNAASGADRIGRIRNALNSGAELVNPGQRCTSAHGQKCSDPQQYYEHAPERTPGGMYSQHR